MFSIIVAVLFVIKKELVTKLRFWNSITLFANFRPMRNCEEH